MKHSTKRFPSASRRIPRLTISLAALAVPIALAPSAVFGFVTPPTLSAPPASDAPQAAQPATVAPNAMDTTPDFRGFGLQAFGLAIRSNDETFVGQMQALGLGPGYKDSLRNNLLMMAIREGADKVALEMLKFVEWQTKAVLEYRNSINETAMMLAAIKGLDGVIRELLKLKAEVNHEGWAPLHYAASAGHLSTVRLLVESDAYIDAASPNGTTPLMMAVRFNHQKVAGELLRLGADPTVTNQGGYTARDYAVRANNEALARWLEAEEIAFTNRYLANLPKDGSDAPIDQLIIRSGGEVILIEPEIPSQPKP